jgi:hypothetical protein
VVHFSEKGKENTLEHASQFNFTHLRHHILFLWVEREGFFVWNLDRKWEGNEYNYDHFSWKRE